MIYIVVIKIYYVIIMTHTVITMIFIIILPKYFRAAQNYQFRLRVACVLDTPALLFEENESNKY